MAIPKLNTLQLEIKDGLFIMLFNRPARFNAFTNQMYNDVVSALQWADKEESVVAALIGGRGTYYSSGNDLANFGEAASSGLSPQELSKKSSDTLFEFVNAFIHFSKPLIAAVNGPCIGTSTTITSIG